MESQQPRLAFALRAFKQGQIIFTAEDCEINIYFDDAKAAEIQAEYQVALQDWPRPGDELVIFEIFPSKRLAMPAFTRSSPSDIEEAENWFNLNDPQLDWTDARVIVWMLRPKNRREEKRKLVQWMQEYVAVVRGSRKQPWRARVALVHGME
jgi:hypothetical protein